MEETRIVCTHSRPLAVISLVRRTHLVSAGLFGVFALLHLGNHVAGLAGQEQHRLVQGWLRHLYQGWMEPVLLLSCAVQLVTGLYLAWCRRYARGRALLQPLSGLYIALFLSIHVVAVLLARANDIETDLAFAAAGMHVGYWWLFFAPYYGLAVFLLAVHFSVPLSRRHFRAARMLVVASIALAILLVLLLAGKITPLEIPPKLIESFPG